MRGGPFTLLRLLLLLGCWAATGSAEAALRVSPAAVTLDNPEATQQVLVNSSESPADITRQARYEVVDPAIAAVDATGLVQPKAEGRTVLVVRHGQQEARVPVEVRGLTKPPPVSFEGQVIPILSKRGCNAGGCHGKAEGKNGFKLSVFGFDPAADHQALTMEARGRRIFPASPDSSRAAW